MALAIIEETIAENGKKIKMLTHSNNFNIRFYCPICKKIDEKSTLVCAKFKILNNDDISEIKFDIDYLDITCKCRDCGNYKVAIDSKIADSVELLNRKGFKTLYSCSGHIDWDKENKWYYYRSQPYICFDKYYDELNNVKLPKKWIHSKEQRVVSDEEGNISYDNVSVLRYIPKVKKNGTLTKAEWDNAVIQPFLRDLYRSLFIEFYDKEDK